MQGVVRRLWVVILVFLRISMAGGADIPCNSTIRLGASYVCSNVPYLTSYNDTRINLALLLEDNALEYDVINYLTDHNYYEKSEGLTLPLYIWTYAYHQKDYSLLRSKESLNFMRRLHEDYYQFWQRNRESMRKKGIWIRLEESSLCRYYCEQSELGASFDFIDELLKTSLNDSEKYALGYARYQLLRERGKRPLDIDQNLLTEGLGQAFYRYLEGANHFYQKEYDLADAIFLEIAESDNDWLQETSVYLHARIALKIAQEGILSKWTGALTKINADDRGKINRSREAFNRYLERYPEGRYYHSALGLLRRLNWLEGDEKKVVRELEQWYADPQKYLGNADNYEERLAGLILEVDREALNHDLVKEPRILAVRILTAMRYYRPGDLDVNGWDPYSDENNPRAEKPSFEELVGQYRSQFNAHPRLYNYLVATYYTNIDPQPKKVIELLPILDEKKSTLSTLELSEQILRARAFEAQKRWTASEIIWKELYKRMTTPIQKELVEAGLAGNYVLADRIERAFSEDSLITTPEFLDSLLTNHADPSFLRNLILRDEHITRKRQAELLYLLLYQDIRSLNHQHYFVDLGLVEYLDLSDQVVAKQYSSKKSDWEDVRFDFFAQPISNKYGYECGTPTELMAKLENNANNSHTQLCYSFLIEAMPSYSINFSSSGQFTHLKADVWSKSHVTKYDIYRRVIDNPSASRNDRALALSRAINCYNRGINRCDNKEIPKSERRRWFQLLKGKYGDTKWAKEQKYYW